MNSWEPLDFRYRVVEQNQAAQVGNPDNVNAGIQQIDIELFDFFGFCQGQCYVEPTNAMGRDQVAQVGEAAQDGVHAIAR
ncbi:hypothetical protein D3C72_2200650 [compost metagenome]